MPGPAPIEHKPWLAASAAAAIAWLWLQDGQVGGWPLVALQAAPLALLAIYALLGDAQGERRALAGMLGLQAAGLASMEYAPLIALNLMLLGYLVGLGLFLGHRRVEVDGNGRAGALALTVGTPLLCLFAAHQAGVGVPIFLGLALGGMAASAWISTFARAQVGFGAALIVLSNVLNIAATGASLAFAAWLLLYIGNLVLAVGVKSGRQL